MVSTFGRNPTEICLIFNKILDTVYNNHYHRLETWNQLFLQLHFLQQYADAINARGAPLENCFGFIDGILNKIDRPQRDQRVVYNEFML